MKGRIYILDSLKGLAIIFVLLTHFTFTASERLAYFFPLHVTMAVPIFMIVSGYTFALSCEKKGIQNFSEYYTAENIINKVLRFTIPFLVIIAIEFILDYGLMRRGTTTREIARIFAGGADKGFGAYYYPVMMQFIFMFPAIYLIIKKNPQKGLALLFIVNCVFEFMQMSYYMNAMCYKMLVFRYIFPIAFGAFLFLNKDKINIWRYVGAFTVGVVFIICHRYFGYKPRIFTRWSTTSCLAVLYLVPIMTFIIKKLASVRIVPLELVGKASYNIFLIQIIYYSYFSEKLAPHMSDGVQCVVGILICIAAGMIFYVADKRVTGAICKAVDKRIAACESSGEAN